MLPFEKGGICGLDCAREVGEAAGLLDKGNIDAIRRLAGKSVSRCTDEIHSKECAKGASYGVRKEPFTVFGSRVPFGA